MCSPHLFSILSNVPNLADLLISYASRVNQVLQYSTHSSPAAGHSPKLLCANFPLQVRYPLLCWPIIISRLCLFYSALVFWYLTQLHKQPSACPLIRTNLYHHYHTIAQRYTLTQEQPLALSLYSIHCCCYISTVFFRICHLLREINLIYIQVAQLALFVVNM